MLVLLMLADAPETSFLRCTAFEGKRSCHNIEAKRPDGSLKKDDVLLLD